MIVYIYGASDDLIEVDGDLREEFYSREADEDERGDYVALSTGTLIRVTYDGNWNLRVLAHGDALVTKYEAVESGGTYPEGLAEDVVPEYSDVVVVEAPHIQWLVHGSNYVTVETSVPRHE